MSRRPWFPVALALAVALGLGAAPPSPDDAAEARPPGSDADLKFWLETMLVDHRYSDDEAAAVIGADAAGVRRDAERLGVRRDARRSRRPGDPLRVLPYPGGRHPRIGFLDGAIRPQRETKVSVFTPWDDASYVVVDVPEALWSNLGLTYLAHTHVPTVWSKQGITLPRKEWDRRPDGSLAIGRTLPNGIAFDALVVPGPDAVRMTLRLTNGSKEPLSDLRVQQCVMLKGAPGFTAQTNENKVFRAPYVACKSNDGRRWIINAWTPCHRAWGNAPCPCLHSDPKFPDCPPGATRVVRGWLSFYEGDDLDAELARIAATRWDEADATPERQP